ncbi:MAG: TldD/PmbA family protein [Candidatus Heimdallarchaeota archaeon]
MSEVLADLALKHAEKYAIDALEVFIQKKSIKKLEIINGVVKNLSEHDRSGLAFRSLINNQMSFVSTNDSNRIEEAIELSAQNAKNSEFKVCTSFTDKKFITPVEGIRDDRLRDLTLEDMSGHVIEILKSIEESKPVKKIDGSVTIEIEERLVANSEGLWKREVGTRMNAEIMTMIKIDDFYGIGSSRITSREFHEDWQNQFNSTIQTAYNQQGRQQLSIGKPKGAILSSQAFANLLVYSLLPSFFSTGNKHFYESIRNCRFNKDIQFVDDPTYPGAQNTFGFDDEGYPSKPRIVLSNGKCKRLLGMNFICTSDGQQSSNLGNCYRVFYPSIETRSYIYSPSVSSSNFAIRTKKPVKNLLEELSDGIYIKEVSGAQDSNYFSGDFVVSVVEGYEVKNGEIVNPITPCFCSGNIYRILEDLSLLVSETSQEVQIPTTPLNVISPEIMTSRITISI